MSDELFDDIETFSTKIKELVINIYDMRVIISKYTKDLDYDSIAHIDALLSMMYEVADQRDTELNGIVRRIMDERTGKNGRVEA